MAWHETQAPTRTEAPGISESPVAICFQHADIFPSQLQGEEEVNLLLKSKLTSLGKYAVQV